MKIEVETKDETRPENPLLNILPNVRFCDITVSHVEIEEKTMGLEICTIKVVDENNRKQKFRVRLLMNSNNNRVNCEVSAFRPNMAQDVKKRVMGAWYP